MTPQQQRVYDIIKKHYDQYQCSPTLTDIGKEMGVTHQRVSMIVSTMVEKGFITSPRRSVLIPTLVPAN